MRRRSSEAAISVAPGRRLTEYRKRAAEMSGLGGRLPIVQRWRLQHNLKPQGHSKTAKVLTLPTTCTALCLEVGLASSLRCKLPLVP
eukprot:jgi/Chlat1/5424/Chrsp35S05319